MRTQFSDIELVEKIKSGGTSLDEVMRFMYSSTEFRNGVRFFVSNNGGQIADVEDIFQDGIAHLIMNVRKGQFNGKSSLKTYFISICKNLWLQKLRRSQKLNSIKKDFIIKEKTNINPEKILLFTEKSSLLSELLNQMGLICKQIISLWSLGYSMKEITAQIGYKTEGVVRKKKHLCMQKMIALVQNNQYYLKELSKKNE